MRVRKNKIFKKVNIILPAVMLCMTFGNLHLAAENTSALVNENFETGYADRGDVGKNITLSEAYDLFADKKKCGYMVYKQITSGSYDLQGSDREGYNSADRIYSNYSSTYGNLGSALCLYPNTKSAEKNWWICIDTGYADMTADTLSGKTLDINFALSDSGDAGRAADIKLCANVDGTEKEYLIGLKSIKKGTGFLNSYHKRVRLKDVLKGLSGSEKMSDIRIKITAPKGKTMSVVKLDDIHIREVKAKELAGWDFEAEDCFTKDFDKDDVTLSTCETSKAQGRVLKIESLNNETENSVRFKIPNMKKDGTLKIYLKAMMPQSGGGAKVRLVNVGDFSKWEIGDIRASGEFETFKKEICLPNFYGVGNNLKDAAIEIAFDGDVCYLDDLTVYETESDDEPAQVRTDERVNENFEKGYIDRGAVHDNISLSESYNGFADNALSGYMVYKQILPDNYNTNESDRRSYDTENREYGTVSEKWGKLGSAIYLYPTKEEWYIDTSLGYEPMSGKDFARKALDVNITFADSGSGGRIADAALCFRVNGIKKEVSIGEKQIKTGEKFLNSYHRRIRLSEISADLSADDIISDISFKLSAPSGENSSVVKFDDIHVRETDPNELNGNGFEAEDLYTDDFSYMTERLSSVESPDGKGRMLKIRAVNEQYFKQTRFGISDINKDSVLDISFKLKLPKTNSVCKGANVRLRYTEKSGDLGLGKIPNSNDFVEFKKTVKLSEIPDLNTDFSRSAIEVYFEGAVGDVCYMDDLSIKQRSPDDFTAEVQGGAEQYFPTNFIYIHFNKAIDAETVKHTGNVRVNDSVDVINRIELISQTDMIITLNEKMYEDYHYFVELRNLKSADGTDIGYKIYDVLVKNDKNGAVVAAQYRPTYNKDNCEVVLPFMVNCDTKTREFTYMLAAYDDKGKMLGCTLHRFNIDKGSYVKDLSGNLNLPDESKVIKMFLWENVNTPLKNAGVMYSE